MQIYPDQGDFIVGYDNGENQIVYSSIAMDMETPVSLMLKLAGNETNSFLLESVTGGEIRGRYSIIGMSPDIIWQCANGRASIYTIDKNGLELEYVESGHPFESLRKLINRSRVTMPLNLPASSCGLFGYLGYDMIRLVEDLPNINPDKLETPDARLVRPSIVAVLDGVKSEVTIVSPAWVGCAAHATNAYEQAVSRVENVISKMGQTLNDIRSPDTRKYRTAQSRSEVSQKKYMEIVEKAKQYIRAGDIFQVVPSQRWVVPFTLPPFSLYRALRRTNPSPFMFYFNFGCFQIVGASPEILVRVFDNEITIRPIAGTRPRGKTLEEDRMLAKSLLDDPKECAEHLMLLDLGRNDVGKVSKIGTVKPTEKFIIERYSHVMHIVSNVVGELAENEDSLSALLAGLPAGTVSGAPKVRAMEIIDELEQTKRGIYGGGVGYFSSGGDMDMCIALRTGVIKDNILHIQAGGGVVYDSDPAAEWQETVNKSGALVKAAEDAYLFVNDIES